jgi:hypothetical protein
VKGMRRPEMHVLDDEALLPARNSVRPPPNRFTHVVSRRQPFFFGDPQPSHAFDGYLDAGTRVLLFVHDGGTYCRVVDERGWYVATEYASLEPCGS